MRFRLENRSAPEPAWFNEEYEGRSWAVRCADVEWTRARLRWARENARSLDDLNAMYDGALGYETPPRPAPRRAAEIERRLIEALAAPGARRE